MEKLLLEAINHIKSVSKKKNPQKQSPYLINKSSATNCDEATIQDTLCILRKKNLIGENLKLLCENNALEIWDLRCEILPVSPPGTPNISSKDANKIYDIVLNDIKKDIMGHINSKLENLKAPIDNEFNTVRRSIEDLNIENFITDNMVWLLAMCRGWALCSSCPANV